jgi:Big-like domain-containing protein/VCBS repeat protein
MTYDSGGADAYSVAIADVNGDGKLDLVVANCGPSGSGGCGSTVHGVVSVLLGNGDGTFQAAVTYDSGGLNAFSVAVADVNGDGTADVLVASDRDVYYNSTSGMLGVLLGNGDGTFQKAVTYLTGGLGSTSVVVVDVNRDSKLDLLIANGACKPNNNYGGCVGVLLGNGDGTFQPVVTYDSGGGETSSVAVADVNGDGKLDLLVTNWFCLSPNAVVVLLGNGDGTFQAAVSYGSGGETAWSIAVADVNGDGKPDLLVANQCAGNTPCTTDAKGFVGVLLNNGDGTFQPALPYYSGGVYAVFLVATDINGDGRPDIVVVNRGRSNGGRSVGILLNNTQASSPTTTTLVSSLNPSVVGQAVTFTARVSSSAGAPPNGETITFKNGSAVLGTGMLSSGMASLTTSSLAAGIYTITASYPGDANFAASTSPGLRQVVNSTTKSPTTTTFVSSLNPSIYGQKIMFTATVTTTGSLPPTGTVYFTWSDGFRVFNIGAATVNSSGIATLIRSNLNADPYPLKATYHGDTNNLASTSPILNQTVLQTTSAAALTSSVNPSTVGQAITFTAKITSPTVTPSGPVTFKTGTTVLGTAQLSSGKAIFTTSTLPAGSTVVKATYNGNSNIKGSSASITQTVQP